MKAGTHQQKKNAADGVSTNGFGVLPRNNPNPVIEVNARGLIVFANEVSQNLATANSLPSPVRLLPREYLNHVASALQDRKSILRLESEIGDLTYAWALVPDGTQDVVYFYGADITEHKEAEKSLREQKTQLLHAQKMDAIGNLAAGIAHDFNNFLNAIRGFAELTLLDLNDREKISHNQEVIKETVDSATKLVRQLLTFSSEQTMELALLDINESVRAMERMLQSLVGSKVTIECDLCRQINHVKANRAMIDQLILNLVINAKDAMPDGGKIVLRTRYREHLISESGVCGQLADSKYLELSVSDEGIGMDDETKMRIFEPFFTTKGADKGTGLGLSTVYGIVKNFKGNIMVDTAPGKGTTFTILLPLSGKEDKFPIHSK